MENYTIKKQDIISGSSRLVSKNQSFDKLKYTLDNMNFNHAYIEHLRKKNIEDKDKKILEKFKKKFLAYRNNWKAFKVNVFK